MRTHLDITDLLEFLCAGDVLHGVQNVTHQLILQLRDRGQAQLIGFHPIHGRLFSLDPAQASRETLADVISFKALFGLDGRRPVKSPSAIRHRHPTRPVRRRFEHAKRWLRLRLRAPRAPARPLVLHADIRGFAIAPGDPVIAPGLNVWYPEHNRSLGAHVRAQDGRLVVVVHDLGPLTAAQYFPESYQAAFRGWIESLFPYADLFVADSEHTRREMQAVAPELRRADCVVNLLAHEFPNALLHDGSNVAAALRPEVAQLKDYVLHVGRIEPRKNMVGLIKVWALLADELGPALPLLVLAGRMNDPSGAFASALRSAGPAAGRIRFVKDPSAAELARLYAGCRFAVYPSFYEGWGLPVGEAACFGKVTAASGAASIPEVVGDLAVYFDPHDLNEMAEVLRRLIVDHAYLAALEARIMSDFHPRSWADCARRLLAIADGKGGQGDCSG